jgi:hypothetical protein
MNLCEEEASELIEILEQIRHLFVAVLGLKNMTHFEIGRARNPDARRRAKRYQHQLIGCPELPAHIAAFVERSIIDEAKYDPRFHPEASRSGGGGAPREGGQWVYILWNGEELAGGCFCHL